MHVHSIGKALGKRHVLNERFTFPIYKNSLAEQSLYLKIIFHFFILLLLSVLHINDFAFLGNAAAVSLASRHIW